MRTALINPVKILFISLSILFSAAGCTNISIYRNPVSELSESAARTRVAIETMAQESNRAEVTKRALQAALESKPFGSDEQLEGFVTYDYIKVTSDAIRLIEQLATRMLEVIDADAGATVAKTRENVGLKAQTIATNSGNAPVARYAGPVSSLGRTVVKIYDENKREEMLSDAVNKGIPAAQTIIELLKEDFRPGGRININEALIQQLDMVRFEKVTRLHDLLLKEQSLSEEEKKQPKRIDARMALALEIVNAYQARKMLKTTSMVETLDALSRTLDNLKKVVVSNTNPKEFAIFSKQLTEFTAKSVELLKAVDALQEAGKKQI